MSGLTPRLAVFDCDGTLVDGQHEVCAAMESAFAQNGLTAPERHDIRRIVGLSLPHALRRLAPEASDTLNARLVAAYKEAFFEARQSGRLHEPLFDGVRELLAALDEGGWLLAVATGKSDRGLNACLATHGISDRFISLQTADRHPGKPDPAMLEAAMADAGTAPEDTVMIGDTTFDIAMGLNAGVRSLGVAWGYHESDELLACGAEAVARDVAHLQELLG